MSLRDIAIYGLSIIGSGSFAMIVTQALKKLTIDPNDTVKVRTTAAFLSALSIVVAGLVDGTLSQPDVASVIATLISAATAWGVSHVSYQVTKPAEDVSKAGAGS